MPSYIVHHNGWFFQWSTITDSPTTNAMRREDFIAWYRVRYGTIRMDGLPARLERAVKNGTSAIHDESAQDMIAINRAGPREKELSFEEVLKLVGADK